MFKHHRLTGDVHILFWINGEALELAGFLKVFCLVGFYFINPLVFFFFLIFSLLLQKHLSLALGGAGEDFEKEVCTL